MLLFPSVEQQRLICRTTLIVTAEPSNVSDILLDFLCKQSIGVFTESRWGKSRRCPDRAIGGAVGGGSSIAPLRKGNPSMTSIKEIRRNLAQPSKATIVERLLKSRNGVSISDIGEATGWQPHSCRAFLTGMRKKGHIIVRDQRKDGSSRYRLGSSQPQATVQEQVSASDAPSPLENS
ncbi:MAG: DUF3489 domain-containing protein [Sphingomonadaceae bacterium]|jgi:hypothetical protein